MLALAALFGSVLAVAGASDSAQAAGSSLAGETFTGSSVADSRWVSLGGACLTAATTAGTGTALGACSTTTHSPTKGASPGYLQLTDDSTNRSSSVLYNRPLPSTAGIDVKFDTYQYGDQTAGADGIGFFLTDGSYTLGAAGPTGGSLGYTTRTDTKAPGIAHGYLGVGLDVYGNNSYLPVYQGSGCTTLTSHAQTAQSVVVRGPGDGTVGYCVLGTTPVGTVQSGATLDARSATATVPSLLASARRNVEITVSPTTPSNPYPTVRTFIDFTGSGTSYVLVSSVTIPAAAPATLKLGFSASTGTSREAHLIQGVQVTTVDAVGDIALTSQVDRVSTVTPARFTAGDTVPLQFLVTSAGTGPLSGIAVTDPGLTGVSCPSTSLRAADSMICTASKVLTAADVASGTYSTTSTVTGTSAAGAVTASSTTTAPAYLAAIGLTQSSNPAAVTAAGQRVTFSSTVANTGTVPLTSVGVVSTAFTGSGALTGPTCTATTLAVGASTVCTATYSTTQADVEAGSITESVRATAAYNGTAVTPRAAASTVAATSLPALTITPTGAPTSITAAGQAITSSFLVTNTGNRALGSIAVPEDSFTGSGALGPVSCPADVLAIGAHETCTVGYTATQADVDGPAIALTVHASGATSGGTAVSSTAVTVTQVSAHGPALVATVAASPSTITAAGQAVQLTYVLTNTGNVTLGSPGVAVSTTGTGTSSALSCGSATLAVGAWTSCSTTYTTTQADVEAGTIAVVGHGTADDHGTPIASSARTATITATPLPALSIMATTSPATFDAAGQALTAAFLVTNTGNLVLRHLTVPVTSFGGSGPVGPISCPVAALAVGASTSCTADYPSTQADLDAGGVVLHVKARSTTAAGTAVTSAVAAATYAGVHEPALVLTTAANPTAVTAAAQRARFDFLVTNTGNVTVSDVDVPITGFTRGGPLASPSCTAGRLAPGASTTCSSTYTVTQSDVEAGSVAGTATATASDSGTAVASVDHPLTLTAVALPALAVTATSTARSVDVAGQVVTYSFVVTNTGNVRARSLTLPVASFTGSGTLAAISCPSSTLDVGEHETCTVGYSASQDDVDAGSVVLRVLGRAVTGTGAVVSSPVVTAARTSAHSAALTMTAAATPSTVTAEGQSVQLRYVLTNTGNVTVRSIAVDTAAFTGSGDPGSVRCASDPIPVGGSLTCVVDYTVTAEDMSAGSFSATASGTGRDGAAEVRSAARTTSVSTRRAPALALQQTASVPRMTRTGQPVRFSYLVSNTGNVALTAVAVSVSSFSGSGALDAPSCPSAGLAAGQTETCTADYTVTQDDMDAGSVTSTAVATGSGRSRSVTSAPAGSTIAALGAAALQVDISSDSAVATRIGQAITYRFLVTNIGHVTAAHPAMAGVQLDAAGTLSSVRCPSTASLAPGATMTCTATYTVQAADVGRTLVVSATATAVAPNGKRATSHPAHTALHVARPAAAGALAFTGSGALGATVGAALLVLVLLLGVLGGCLLLRRRSRTD